ncbi:MAG: hypothetical protein HY334_03525 [Armatimonadetes bacterium]|nr:hypothetical protein [Armatimonadota bacterium]
MQDGLKRHVTSTTVMAECGYGWDAVRAIADATLDSIPQGLSLSGAPCPRLSPPDGSLLKGSGSAVYVMENGLKRHIPNPVTFAAQGFLWGNVNRIADSSLNAIPTGDPLPDVGADGSLLKGSGSAVYVMQDGLKRHVTSPTVMAECGYSWDAIFVIPDSVLNAIPTGSALSGPPCP